MTSSRASRLNVVRPATELPRGAVSGAGRVPKRCLDIVVSSTMLLLLSPLMAALWVLVRCSGPGGAIYKQERVGRGERTFRIYKFRTMHADNDDRIHRDYVQRLLTDADPVRGAHGLYKLDADPRITRVGGVLRRWSLDELPQLVNVLCGSMSLVGPRPALPWEATLFGETHRARFQVPPGLTGLWQISGRNRLTMRQGLDLDVEYVRRRSLRLDLLILIKTVPAVLGSHGA